ncbi:MAG: M48 family metalloprotease [Frankiaceae bacterium]
MVDNALTLLRIPSFYQELIRGLVRLSAPWRATASVLAGRHPRQGLSIVLVAGLTVAEVRAVQQGQWMAGGVLVLVGLTAALVPLANAAISRRSEYAADHGLAIELTAILRVLNDGNRAPRGWSRLLSTHPTYEQRIKALQTATIGQRSDGGSIRHAGVHIAGPAEPLVRAGVSRRELKQGPLSPEHSRLTVIERRGVGSVARSECGPCITCSSNLPSVTVANRCSQRPGIELTRMFTGIQHQSTIQDQIARLVVPLKSNGSGHHAT